MLFIVCTAIAGAARPAGAFIDANLHASISVVNAVTVAETSAVRFGNFTVACGGGVCDGGASITMDHNGARGAANSAGDTITLLTGASAVPAAGGGAAAPGYFNISGADPNAQLYVTFSDSAGVEAPVELSGPAGANGFTVDNFTFNKNGTDVSGDYILANGAGHATVRVGAMLHTKPGALPYPEGVYRGTFSLLVSY